MVAHFSLAHSPTLLAIALLGLVLGLALGYLAWRYGWQPHLPERFRARTSEARGRLLRRDGRPGRP